MIYADTADYAVVLDIAKPSLYRLTGDLDRQVVTLPRQRRLKKA